MMSPRGPNRSFSRFSINSKRRPWAASRARQRTRAILTRSPARRDAAPPSRTGAPFSLVPAAAAAGKDERGAGVGPRRLDALDDPLLHAGDALGGCEHLVLRPVLAATALGHDHDPERRARADVDMDHGWRVVAGVHAIERRADDRGAEVSLRVALPHAVVDGVVEATPGDVDVLAELDEADDEARVLAVGDAPGPCHLGVLLQDLEHLLPGRRPLPPERPVEGPQHVGLEVEVRLDAELLDRVGDRADVDVPHGRPTSSAGPSTR